MLEVKDLKVSYKSVKAVNGVSFSVKKGDLVAILGNNGAGKSTLLNTISGLVSPESGGIFLNGRSIIGFSTDKLVKMGLVLIPEGRQVVGNMSVRDNLLLGAVNKEQYKNIEKIFQILPVLKERQNQTAGLLSGGEQQMLVIGRALMSNPEILLIDEPTLGLAPQMAVFILNLIKELSQKGKTIVLVEQNVNLALKICTNSLYMQKGILYVDRKQLTKESNRSIM